MSDLRCSKCGQTCQPQDRFCTSCGTKLTTPYFGLRRRQKADSAEEKKRRPVYLAPLHGLLEYFPGLVQPGVMIVALLTAAGAVFVALLGAWLIALGAGLAGMFIAGFAMIMYWAAVAWLMYGSICALSEVLADFSSTQWMVFLVVGLAPIGLSLAAIDLLAKD